MGVRTPKMRQSFPEYRQEIPGILGLQCTQGAQAECTLARQFARVNGIPPGIAIVVDFLKVPRRIIGIKQADHQPGFRPPGG